MKAIEIISSIMLILGMLAACIEFTAAWQVIIPIGLVGSAALGFWICDKRNNHKTDNNGRIQEND